MTVYGSGLPLRFRGITFTTKTLVSKDPELGTRTVVAGNEYVWAYNGGNSEIPSAYACVLQSGATGMTMTLSSVTSADLVVGFSVATIATDTYGWLITRGIGKVTMGATSGSVASRGLIEVAANGLCVPVSNTTGNLAPAVGQALAAIVSSASGSAYVSCY
jgi:hypothetical protein